LVEEGVEGKIKKQLGGGPGKLSISTAGETLKWFPCLKPKCNIFVPFNIPFLLFKYIYG